MGSRQVRLPTLIVGPALVACFALACGGGGGGGGGSGPTAPTSGIVFRSMGAAGGASITLSQVDAGNPDQLTLEVTASGIGSLYGVAFDLQFPSAVLSYGGASEGMVLDEDGAATSFQVYQKGPGQIVVGLSRLGMTGGVAANGALLQLRFAAVANGSGAVAFSQDLAYDGSGSALDSVSWSGGTVSVVR